MMAANPCVKLPNGARGYIRCTVTPTNWQANYMVVDDVLQSSGRRSWSRRVSRVFRASERRTACGSGLVVDRKRSATGRSARQQLGDRGPLQERFQIDPADQLPLGIGHREFTLILPTATEDPFQRLMGAEELGVRISQIERGAPRPEASGRRRCRGSR